jgi:hypothetical protein
MAAKRPTQASDKVTPTETGQTDGTVAAVADPALAAPGSSSTTVAQPEVVAEPVATVPAAVATVPVADATVPVAAAAVPVADAAVPVADATVPAADAAVPAAPAQQVVYVEAPKPFVKKGNRGFGVLIAILSAVIFAALNAIAQVVFELVNGQPIDFSFITTTGFYAPVLMFAVGFILVVLVVNRAGWPAHVLGSIFVGLVVFFGGTGLLLLLNISQIPSNEVSETFTRTLFSPELIIAALLAREVSLWMGAAIASRGRKVKVRNVDAKVLYDQEIAAKRAEYEQANAVGTAAVPAAAVAETPATTDPATTDVVAP